MKFNNGLSDSELERLAILSEEMGEAIQVIGKIIRHGYESFSPYDVTYSNRMDLERELGHVLISIDRVVKANDVRNTHVKKSITEKRESIKQYLHHQGE